MRQDSRRFYAPCPVFIRTGLNSYTEDRALCSFDRTEVMCTASLESGLPSFMVEELGQGWVTAEYAMLPRSIHTHTDRRHVSNGFVALAATSLDVAPLMPGAAVSLGGESLLRRGLGGRAGSDPSTLLGRKANRCAGLGRTERPSRRWS
jgi:hypothetical protein